MKNGRRDVVCDIDWIVRRASHQVSELETSWNRSAAGSGEGGNGGGRGKGGRGREGRGKKIVIESALPIKALMPGRFEGVVELREGGVGLREACLRYFGRQHAGQ